MASSYENIKNEETKKSVIQWTVIAIIVVATIIIIALSLDSPDSSKIIVSFGLILDFVGVILVSYTIVFPLKKKAKPGVQYLSNLPKYRAQAVTEYAERHEVKLRIGVFLILIGFLMQIIGSWI